MVGTSSNLHAYLLTWNLAGFKRYLEGNEPVLEPPAGGGGGGAGGGGGSSKQRGDKASSGPRSWSMHGMTTGSGSRSKPDPNERDAFGRTVLHLVCSTLDPRAYDYLYYLLALPTIAVNVQDAESGWTALHRAMWCGNLRAARELLARSDTDLSIKDAEGLTAMDLYNSTSEGTNPDANARGTDLFVWGSNKNCTLGLGDSADRALPERVNLLTQVQASQLGDSTPRKGGRALGRPANGEVDSALDSDEDKRAHAFGPRNDRFFTSKFDQVGINQIVLSKFHTAAVTSDASANLSLCGFGGSARLGRPVHTQYALLPQPDISHRIVSVALAQDHTLALTSAGAILSWGQNRFSQLGYVIEPPERESAHKAFSTSMAPDDLVQATPKRIVGPLKKEIVVGVAASRMGSACWTSDSVWTWGTNSGQLGYDKTANPVQVLPRKVTGITQTIRDLAMTDYAMAYLLDTYEVLVYYADMYIRVSFPTQRFPSDFSVYRPPQFVAKPTITKITSCGATFAALSSLGDVFSFSLQNPIDADVSKDPNHKQFTIKPQMVWALRKRFTAVKDVALGSDGAVIICTHSGHVYVRQRANKQWSFKRVPYLQRVIKVAANESGSFAAIRSDAEPSSVGVVGHTLGEDLLDMLPAYRQAAGLAVNHGASAKHATQVEEDEEDVDEGIQRDCEHALQLALAVARWDKTFEDLSLGTDAWLEVSHIRVPVHLFLLEARVPSIRHLLAGQAGKEVSAVLSVKETTTGTRLILHGCVPYSALLWLQWIYSDEISAIWDNRIQSYLRAALPSLKLDVVRIKRDLQTLVSALGVTALVGPLSTTGKSAIPPTLPTSMASFWSDSQSGDKWSLALCDVVLQLQDKRVYASSVILRARSGFFDAMFDDPQWISHRRDEDGQGRVVIDMTKHKWRSMRLVLQYMHDGREGDLFDYRHQDSLDAFLDFVFEVIAVANELILDRLVLVCSAVIRRHVSILNASSLAAEATLHNATSLKRSLFSYIASNLETMLENGLLDEMDIRVLNDLTSFVQERQGVRLPITRSGILEQLVLEREAEWLSLQDLPVPRIRPYRSTWKAKSPRILPANGINESASRRKSKGKGLATAPNGRDAKADDNDIFDMDEEPVEALSLPSAASAVATAPPAATSLREAGAPWKSATAESSKLDMRSIMAEAERSKPAAPGTPAGRAPARPGVYTPPMMGAATPPRGTPPAAGILANAQAGPSGTPGTWRTVPGATSAQTPVKSSSPSSSAFPSLGAARPAPAPTPARPSLLAQSRTSSPLPSPGPSSRRPSAPVITPAKPPPPEVIVPTRGKVDRRKTFEPAWSTAPIFQPAPVLPVVAASPGSGGQVSLLDIQRQEMHAQQAGSLRLAPMSIADIQAEERRVEQERAAQLEFERWWKAEEDRVQAEQRRLAGGGGGGSRGGSSKKKGRGGGGGGEAHRGGRGRGGGPSGSGGAGPNRNANPTGSGKTGSAGRSGSNAPAGPPKPASEARIDD